MTQIGSLHAGRSISAHLAEDVHPRNTAAGRPASVHAIAKMCFQVLHTKEFGKFYLILSASQAQWSGWKRWEEEVLQLHYKEER